MHTMPRLLCAAALAAAAAVSVSAQWEPYPWKNMPRTPDGKVDLKAPPRRTADGKIDLSGFWMPTDRVKHLLNLAADLKPGEVPLQPWAQALYQERIETNGKDHPGVRCWPSGIPEKNNIPDGLKVVQTPDLMIFLHESRTIYRQIFTDGRPLPKDAQPAWMGYSVGRWEARRSWSTPSVRTARPGSTCAACPPPRPCTSPSALPGRPSAASMSTSPSTIRRRIRGPGT